MTSQLIFPFFPLTVSRWIGHTSTGAAACVDCGLRIAKRLRQIFLDEAWTQMDVDLHQRSAADRLKTVHFAGFDDKDIAGAPFKSLAVHGPKSAAFPHELDFIIRMAMWAGALARKRPKEKHRDVYIAVFGAN